MSSSPFPAAVQKRRQDQHQSLQEDSLLRPKNTAWLDLKEKPKYHKVTTRAAYGGPVCYPPKKRGEDGPSPFSSSQSFAFLLRNTWRSRLRLVISNNFPSVFVDKPHTRAPWSPWAKLSADRPLLLHFIPWPLNSEPFFFLSSLGWPNSWIVAHGHDSSRRHVC